MSVLDFSPKNFKSLKATITDHIINGLPKKHIGFLISPPDIGKSYLALTIAYAGATADPLLPITTPGNKYKTLYWAPEDGAALVFSRVEKHFSGFPSKLKKDVTKFVGVWNTKDPLARKERGQCEPQTSVIDALISDAKDFDLLIIDTVREAFGPAHEVEDDYLIKTILQRIANEADVAILAIHHPTKSVSRGLETVTTVSGSGLSSTLANSRLHLYIETNTNRKKNSPELQLSYLKANLLSKEEREDIPLAWSENGMLMAKEYAAIFGDYQDANREDETLKPKTIKIAERDDIEGDPDATNFFQSIKQNLEQ